MTKKKTTILTRDQILNANDREPVEVDVPKWGGSVYLIPPSAGDLEGFEDEATLGQLLVRALCDADGQLLFTPADVAGLMEHDLGTMNMLVKRYLEISGLNAEK